MQLSSCWTNILGKVGILDPNVKIWNIDCRLSCKICQTLRISYSRDFRGLKATVNKKRTETDLRSWCFIVLNSDTDSLSEKQREKEERTKGDRQFLIQKIHFMYFMEWRFIIELKRKTWKRLHHQRAEETGSSDVQRGYEKKNKKKLY